ncbi:MAG: DUF302 domain-containing protein [Bacteroidota bacterium]|nr:DUF302 domain-containing protein [Bacteroidota bacterium]
MDYYFNKTINAPIKEVYDRTIEALKDVGFGVITEIDMKEKFKEKLGIDYKKYYILGACNPGIAHEALQMEEYLGILLPCNVIVFEREDRKSEVACVNAVSIMRITGSEELAEVAETVNDKLIQALESM